MTSPPRRRRAGGTLAPQHPSKGSAWFRGAVSAIRRHRAKVAVGVISTVVGGLILALILGPPQRPAPQTATTSRPTAAEIPTAGAIPFRVVDVGQLGLFVRTCPNAKCGCKGLDCEKLGAAPEDTVLWAVCQSGSMFVPSGLPAAPWFKVRWSRRVGGTREVGAGTSDPTESHVGWAYSLYLEPTTSVSRLSACGGS